MFSFEFDTVRCCCSSGHAVACRPCTLLAFKIIINFDSLQAPGAGAEYSLYPHLNETSLDKSTAVCHFKFYTFFMFFYFLSKVIFTL